MESLCRTCSNVREVVSGTGSTFLLCKLSQSDKRFPKYPPQPVVRCGGYEDKPSAMATFKLEVLPSTFAICRLDADANVPEWATGEFLSITRTPDELSIICRQGNVPENLQSELGWRCLRVAGRLKFSMVGVIASLAGTLAAANISVLVVSTFDTDYLLVKEGNLEAAVASLVEAGHAVSNQVGFDR